MLYVFADDQGGVYRKLLRAALPGWEIEAWPAVVDADDQLAPRALLDAAVDDAALDLRAVAVAGVRDRHEPRLVLVAQRQVQREIDVAPQAELVQRALRA